MESVGTGLRDPEFRSLLNQTLSTMSALLNCGLTGEAIRTGNAFTIAAEAWLSEDLKIDNNPALSEWRILRILEEESDEINAQRLEQGRHSINFTGLGLLWRFEGSDPGLIGLELLRFKLNRFAVA